MQKKALIISVILTAIYIILIIASLAYSMEDITIFNRMAIVGYIFFPATFTFMNLLISDITKKRLNFIAPVIFAAIGISIFLYGLFSYAHGDNFIEKLQSYFGNDMSMSFMFTTIPFVIVPPLTILIYKTIKKTKAK